MHLMELIFPIITFFLGYFAEKIADKLLDKLSTKRKNAKNKKQKINISQYDINTVFTEDIYPYISSDNIWVKDNGKKMFLAFPPDKKSQLKNIEGEFAIEDTYFRELALNGFSKSEINDVVERARVEIAEDFIKRDDGLYFNGDKYGIVFLDSKSRTTDKKETPQLLVELFHTDHFTHRVISRAVEMLNPPKSYLISENLNNELNWIRTSFGLSIIVILKSTNQIVMTHRSKKASFTKGKSWIYVSATEAISKADIDEYDNTVDFSLCVKRGIKEELGIKKGMYKSDTIKFYDCFFETEFFQDGMVASIELSEEILPEQVEGFRGKDKHLEIEDIFFIDNTKTTIEKFIEDNKADMRSQTIFALKSYISNM